MKRESKGLSKTGKIVTIVIAVGTAVAFIFQIGAWKGRMDSHMMTVNGHMTTVNDHMKAVNSHMATAMVFMERVQDDIKQLLRRSNRATIQVASPIQLTKLGESVSATIKAPVWAEEHAESLAKQFKGVSAYDIQTYSFRYAQEFEWDKSMDELIKEAAFEEGISRGEVLDILGIELRNKILCLMDISVPELPNC
ncbi:MAG: hypothetical protein OXC65_02370 [Thiotrichales bacterium]|nr:hypothetical protein [Thiotrichales bacterium]